MLVKVLGKTGRPVSVRDVQPLNEYVPSDETLPQFEIVANLVQPLNELEPIEFNEDGNEIVVKPVQPLKA